MFSIQAQATINVERKTQNLLSNNIDQSDQKCRQSATNSFLKTLDQAARNVVMKGPELDVAHNKHF